MRITELILDIEKQIDKTGLEGSIEIYLSIPTLRKELESIKTFLDKLERRWI